MRALPRPTPRQLASALEIEGDLLASLGYLNKSANLRQQVIAILEASEGPDSIFVGMILVQLANVYKMLERTSDAEALYLRSIAILKRHNDPSIAIPLNNLASIFRDRGQYADAAKLVQQAIQIVQTRHAKRGPLAADTTFRLAALVDDLAEIHMMAGNLDEAEQLYRKSIAIITSVGGPDHPDIGPSLRRIAAMFARRKKFPEAEATSKDAVALAEKLGPHHHQVGHALIHLGFVYQLKGDQENALAAYRRAAAIVDKRQDLASSARRSERDTRAAGGGVRSHHLRLSHEHRQGRAGAAANRGELHRAATSGSCQGRTGPGPDGGSHGRRQPGVG